MTGCSAAGALQAASRRTTRQPTPKRATSRPTNPPTGQQTCQWTNNPPVVEQPASTSPRIAATTTHRGENPPPGPPAYRRTGSSRRTHHPGRHPTPGTSATTPVLPVGRYTPPRKHHPGPAQTSVARYTPPRRHHPDPAQTPPRDPRSCVLPWSGWGGSRVETCFDPEGTPKALLTHPSTTSTITQRRPRTTPTYARCTTARSTRTETAHSVGVNWLSVGRDHPAHVGGFFVPVLRLCIGWRDGGSGL